MKEKRGSYAQPFGYTGYQYDNMSNLYFAQARYYDPALGRFVSEDRVKGNIIRPDTINPYIYCLSNPLRYVDRDGNEEKDVDAIMITYDEFPSHTSLLVQDPQNGDWYFFYWGPKEFIPAISLFGTDVGPIFKNIGDATGIIDTETKNVNLEELNKYLKKNHIFNTNKDENNGDIGSDFDHYIYYDGDYSETYKYLNKYLNINDKGMIGENVDEYNLYINNCADVSIMALLQGEGMSERERKALELYYEFPLTIPYLLHVGALSEQLCLV